MIDIYRDRMAVLGSYSGASKRRNSEKIMDASWMRDAATKPVYVKWVDTGLPVVSQYDIPIYAKFSTNSSYNITGDEVACLLQFRLEDIKNNSNIKVGSYVQIKNEENINEWWIIVHVNDSLQFRKFLILKCLWTYQWVSDIEGNRVIHKCLGAPRGFANSGSGLESDKIIQTIDGQHVAILPINNDTHTIQYDTRFLISSPGRNPILAWKVSKITESFSGNVVKFTMDQDQFNPSNDNSDLMIADYYKFNVAPENTSTGVSAAVQGDLKIVYSGQPTVRVGGGYKKFTLKTYNNNNNLVDATGNIEWIVDYSNINSSNLSISNTGNVFKVRCKNDYSLIGKTFKVTAKIGTKSKTVNVEVISL